MDLLEKAYNGTSGMTLDESAAEQEGDCLFCGDTVGYPYCYGCEDTADMLGLDIDAMI